MTDREKTFWAIGRTKGDPVDLISIATILDIDLSAKELAECLDEVTETITKASSKFIAASSTNK